MKEMLLIVVGCCCLTVMNAQHYNRMASSGAFNFHLPAGETHSTKAIAAYLQKKNLTQHGKLSAIYNWVVTNIRYDTDSMLPINWSLDHADKVAATLRRRKGVCENFAALFTDIAVKAGFPSFVVSGYTRQGGTVNNAGHSWSAVMLEGHWYLCDPTWDIGGRGNNTYFLLSPNIFIQTHLPFDPLWQLLERPVTNDQFKKGYSEGEQPVAAINVNDSVARFLLLDSLQQLEAAARRIQLRGVENERLKNWVAYNQMKIAMMYGENDMNLYNGAVEEFNRANAIFNGYAAYRNDRFLPLKPDKELSKLLPPVMELLAAARKKLEQIGKVKENFQYDTGELLERMNSLSKKTAVQQAFISSYLNSDIADRGKLFYK